jgi:serpin B
MGPFVQRILAPAAVLALGMAPGCQASFAAPEVCGAALSSDSAALSLAADDTTFAFALFPPAAQAVGAGRNVILSPYSVSAVLSMLDVGAAGRTAAQIESTLSLPGSGSAVAPAYAALACDDQIDGSAGGNQLSIANALWGQRGKPFQSGFLSTLATGYSAPFQQADFAGDPAGATSDIDQWVSTATQGAIPTLFHPGDLDASTRLVLVNAVYFKGTWATGFDPAATTPLPFTLEDGTEVPVPTMDGTMKLSRGTGTGFTVVEVPYQGGAIVLDLLLPNGKLAALEESLTPAGLQAALGSLSKTNAELLLPKLSYGTRLTLNPVLQGLGMVDAFAPGVANLSGMDSAQDLSVSVVVQQAMIEVDEQGTVAAAATGVGVIASVAEMPTVVRVDHPFLFVLRDTKTGSVLFMGHVEDPRAGS